MTDEQYDDLSQKRRLPAKPTPHHPGSQLKIEVMRLRYERGEHLYHPDDEKRLARKPDPSRWDGKNREVHGTGYEADQLEEAA